MGGAVEEEDENEEEIDEDYEHYIFNNEIRDNNISCKTPLLDQKNDINYQILCGQSIDEMSIETVDKLKALDTAYKKRHIYIYGNPNTGKSNARDYVLNNFRGEVLSLRGGFSTLSDMSVQFILFDEYSPTNLVDLSILNQLTDGTLDHNIKYGAKYRVKDVNTTVIIFSNHSPEKAYEVELGRDETHLQSFYERFNVTNLSEE